MPLSLLPAEQSALIDEAFGDGEVPTYLERVGLVSKKKIAIPLFLSFIQEEYKNNQRNRTLLYDEKTNTITKGTMVLSDQLTSSEFRLLRYMLQQQNTIVERDNVIHVVWPDVKSTAGITDQAVDQLIFRVRRKIEEDPNHPKHLLTIKGRGFKLEA